VRIAIYIVWGAILFHFPLRTANWFSVILVLAASLLSFSGLGILSASYLLMFKRGNPAKWLLIGLWGIAGGMLFPVTILPDWLQIIAALNPMTYALNAMRAALLGGAGISQLLQPIEILLAFAVVLLPLSISVFSWTLNRTKATGTLAHR
jgi:ABC-2 type transport system permease protein